MSYFKKGWHQKFKSMVKQPRESHYSKYANRINEMKEVYELHYVQHLREKEILSLKGLNRSSYYQILRNFAAEYPELADQMKKKGSAIVPDDYKKEKLRADFYEEMVAFGKEVYGIDLKKAGTK